MAVTSDGNRPSVCGEKSLFTSLNVLGVECDLEEIERRLKQCGPIDKYSLADLANVAESYGTYPAVMKLRELDDLSPGAILHVKSTSGHFLTFLGFEGRYVVLGDAPIPPIRVDRDMFVKHWSGNALLIFKTAPERDAYRRRMMINNSLFYGAFLWPLIALCVICFRRWQR
jgi:ABC-type bacteriocin/lantibiotic exporter with double-glycine peptidase domain